MNKDTFKLNLGKIGMNLDSHEGSLKEQSYTYALNTNIQNGDGDNFHLQNESSNLLCSKFKDGFKVVGFKKDINTDKVYYFLKNNKTGVSEIGYIENNECINDIEDVEVQCQCDYKNLLSKPLEDSEQVPYCKYRTIISDDCNLCLNFKTSNTIDSENIVIKDESCGKTIYWTDGINPPRHINMNNLSQYKEIGYSSCGEVLEPTCIDCDKLRIFKTYGKSCLEVDSAISGGDLLEGVYEFLLAYCDKAGNVISDYHAITNPVPIFNSKNINRVQPDFGVRTDQSIKVTVSNIDSKFSNYKIAVIFREALSQGVTQFIEGVHSTDEEYILLTTEQGKEKIRLLDLFVGTAQYKTTQGMTSEEGYLFQYGLEVEEVMNLQPVMNLLGGMAQWITYRGSSDIYDNPASVSKYLSYQRDEVVPFSIRFSLKNGGSTQLIPLISRPSIAGERDTVSEGDNVYDSINEYGVNCSTTNRTEKWQFCNTAIAEEVCPTDISDFVCTKITREEICRKAATNIEPTVGDVPPHTLLITDYEDFESLEQYINAYSTEIQQSGSSKFNSTLAAALAAFPTDCEIDLPALNNAPDVCTGCEILGSVRTIVAYNVVDEVVTTEFEELVDVGKSQFNILCNQFPNTTALDADFNTTTGLNATIRNSAASYENCLSPKIVSDSVMASLQGVFMDYYFHAIGANLVSTVVSLTTDAQFDNNFLHNGAVWYRHEFKEATDILEISSLTTCSSVDDLTNTRVRASYYDKCPSNGGVFIGSYIIEDLAIGEFLTLNAADFNNGFVYISIDAPIISGSSGAFISAPCGCFDIAYRGDIPIKGIEVGYTSIDFDMIQTYRLNCNVKVPNIDPCKPTPYNKGRFAFTESTRDYPDNSELYNSQHLVVSDTTVDKIPLSDRVKFIDYYTDSLTDGVYTLKDGTDFACKPIRHFRFPDNVVSPFMSGNSACNVDNAFYPIGINFNNATINVLLDLAVENKLITKKQRNTIVSYEVFRGDRSADKSVIANGYLYDMYKYRENGTDKEVHYANYPYNDLNPDLLHSNDSTYGNVDTAPISHPFSGDSNNKFSFHSPETHFFKPSLGTEATFTGVTYGCSSGHFSDVDGHANWKLLTSKAYGWALGLAGAEVTTNLVLNGSEVISNSNISGPVIGAVYIIAAALSTVTSLIRLRKEWLDIFENIAPESNYADFYTSVAKYNQFEPFSPNTDCDDPKLSCDCNGSILRGLSDSKYLRDGRVAFRENGEDVSINHVDRESSVYLSLGDYALDYTNITLDNGKAFKGYDNSRITVGSSGLSCFSGISDNVTKKVASIYTTIKDYKPEQYGSIGSVSWVPTGACLSLSDIVLTNDSVVLVGTSGTATITIGGNAYTITFNTDLATTVSDFITAESTNILNDTGLIITAEGLDGFTLSSSTIASGVITTSIENESGDLGGSVSVVNNCNGVFGGDTFLGFMSLKRKLPIFLNTAIGSSNATPFKYYYNRNIGYPRYFIDYKTTVNDEDAGGNFSLTNFVNPANEGLIQADCSVTKNDNGRQSMFYNPQTNFYLYYYGIPSLPVESSVNLSTRYAGIEPQEDFYGNLNDYVGWTQENFVSIRNDNQFRYNSVYSSKVRKGVGQYTFDESFNLEDYNCMIQEQNGVIYSEKDSSENQITDPFLVYKPNNKYEFPNSAGKLVSLKGIESAQVLGRFGNQMYIFNAVDKIRDRLTSDVAEKTIDVGIGGIFATRPLSFNKTDLGYAGTQHRAIVSCEYGHYWVDAKRGQVFQVNPNGKDLVDISSRRSDGSSTDTRNWFKNQLPFKILKGGIANLKETDLDNPLGGLGIVMGWDSRQSRVFVTKKDYTVNPEYKGKLRFKDGLFYKGNIIIPLSNSTVFTPSHWTMAYSPITQSWISAYSFHPDYYISYNNYFQTGLNTSRDATENGLWSHGLTNKSYQVFYGKKYPWTIEIPTKQEYLSGFMRSVNYWLDVRRYRNEYDFAEDRKIGFNKAWIYNNSCNTGQLNLVLEEINNRKQHIDYPIVNNDSVDILATQYDKKWSFNYLLDRVKDIDNNVPIWLNDSNNLGKDVNSKAMNYGVGMLDRMRGDWFLLKLQQDITSQYKMIYKFSTQLVNNYN